MFLIKSSMDCLKNCHLSSLQINVTTFFDLKLPRADELELGNECLIAPELELVLFCSSFPALVFTW